MYMSYEGGKLTSTIVNLDIEEMSFCFACAVAKHINHGEDNDKKSIGKSTMLHEIPEEQNHQKSRMDVAA